MYTHLRSPPPPTLDYSHVVVSPSFLPLLVFDEIPPPEALQQIAVMEQLPPATSSHQITVTGQLPPISSTSEPPSIPAVTSGLDNFTAMNFSLVPPVPTKLIEKIESGIFVDMSELLSDHLGVLENEDQQKSSKP